MTGAQMRTIRQRCQLSQRALARLLRIHPTSVWKMEHGYKTVTPRREQQLLFVFATHRPPRPSGELCPTCEGTGLLERQM